MKRIFMIVPIAALALGVFAPAGADPVVPSDPTDPVCARAHVTGEDCQGPDHERVQKVRFAVLGIIWDNNSPAEVIEKATAPPDGCRIGVWVGKVTCSGLLPPDGDGSTVNRGAVAYNDPGETATLTIRFIDEVTGVVLREDTASSDTIVQTAFGPFTSVSIGYASFYGSSGDHPVTIEAEGTHADGGAATAALAALGPSVFGQDPVPTVQLPNNGIDIHIN